MWWGEAVGQGFLNVCCLCSFLCSLTEAGWASITERRKARHRTKLCFAHRENKYNLGLSCHFVGIFARVGHLFLGLVEVQKHHGGLACWSGSAILNPPEPCGHQQICEASVMAFLCCFTAKGGKSSQDVCSRAGWGGVRPSLCYQDVLLVLVSLGTALTVEVRKGHCPQ